ncbi:MAG: glycosyltransferase family 39 protein [Chloroflexi bacterium]|nr:glycosyltransferase family 39 protein [Chloroflexota bacterium]
MKKILTRLKSHRAIALVLFAFVSLALMYSVSLPLFEGPDEDDHFRFAKYLADQRALPAQLFEPGGGAAGHQGWQPPLYYALVALIISPLDTSDYSEHLYRNYAVTFVGDPACCGRNIYYHFSNENFPYTRTTLAVHLARLLSILFGAITVAATYALTKILLRDSNDAALKLHSESVALVAASLVAFNPSFLFASALVSNDAPLAAFSALVLLQWARLARGTLALNIKNAASLGALIGLGILTKTTALALIPLSFFLFAILAYRQRSFRTFLSSFFICSFVIFLFTAWWFARNFALYGDPLATRLVLVSALFPREGALTFAEFFQINLPWLWQTFWGGPTPGDFPSALLIGLFILTLLAAFGLLHKLITKKELRLPIFFLGAWFILILVAQIQFIALTVGADQGRYLFPAISVFAFFCALGLNQMSFVICHLSFIVRPPSTVLRPLSFVISSLVIFFPLLTLFAVALPNYTRPPLLSADDLSRAPNSTAINFANLIELRGYVIDARIARPGESLDITLYWRARARMNESYRAFVQLVGAENKIIGSADVIPARGAFPTLYWIPGDALRDVVRVPIFADAPPGNYALQIGWYPVGRPGARLEIVENGDSSFVIGAVEVIK